MTYTLTPEKALELLKRARDERGEDYVYDDHAVRVLYDGEEETYCRYTNDGKPSCIVGHLFSYLADELEKPDIFEELKRVDEANIILSAQALNLPGVQMDKGVAGILTIAQENQDRGHSWGLAVLRAEEYAGGR